MASGRSFVQSWNRKRTSASRRSLKIRITCTICAAANAPNALRLPRRLRNQINPSPAKSGGAGVRYLPARGVSEQILKRRENIRNFLAIFCTHSNRIRPCIGLSSHSVGPGGLTTARASSLDQFGLFLERGIIHDVTHSTRSPPISHLVSAYIYEVVLIGNFL